MDHSSATTNGLGDGRGDETDPAPHDIDDDMNDDDMSDDEMNAVFDRPALWRFEAVAALGIDDADLPAAMSPGPTFPAALRSAVAALPDDLAHVVDLGAGAGGASEWVRLATGAQVHAVEPARRARLAAQLVFPEVHVVDGSAARAPLDAGCADLVTMLGVVSLLDDLTPALTEAARLLGGRGHLVIADLVSASASSWSDADNRFRSVEDLEATVHAHGFVVDTVGCGAVTASGRWGEVAERVDRWIESNCVDRAGYDRWCADKDKLRALARDGQVLGGVLVAHPSPQRMSVLEPASAVRGARVRTRHAWSAGAGQADATAGAHRAGAEPARPVGGGRPGDREARHERTERGRHG